MVLEGDVALLEIVQDAILNRLAVERDLNPRTDAFDLERVPLLLGGDAADEFKILRDAAVEVVVEELEGRP